MNIPDYRKFSRYYSRGKLLDKISSAAKKAGVKTVYAALMLFYASTDSKVPLRDKAIILGALGYFILPFDAIPDMLGPLGYTDDLTALLWALKTVGKNITPEIRHKALTRLNKWFPDATPDDLLLPEPDDTGISVANGEVTTPPPADNQNPNEYGTENQLRRD